MKNLFSAIILSVFSLSLQAQGIEFFHGSWNEALQAADEQGKIIFVDAYTTWCGPCKRMARYVFPLKEVGDFYNEHFISVKLDMERGEGLEFRKNYPVSAYPTFYWIDPDGKVVMRTKGARQPEAFIALGEEAVKKYDGSAKYKKSYEEGARDFETVYAYIKALNKDGKPSLKIANAYLDDQEDLTTEENLRFILEAAVQADSKIFEMLETHQKAIEKMAGEEAVNKQIKNACSRTVKRAIEFESAGLLAEAIDTYKKHFPKESDAFIQRAEMDFAIGMEDAEKYASVAKTYLKKTAKKNPMLLMQFSNEVQSHFPGNNDLLDMAEDAIRDAIKIKPSASNYYSYARLLYARGQKENALTMINKGIELAKENKESIRALENLKSKIGQS